MDQQQETFRQIAAERPRLMAFGARLAGQEGVDDLVQEALLRAMEGWASFTPGTNLRAWLKRILLNCHLNRCSKEAVRRRYAERQDLGEAGGLWVGSGSSSFSRGAQESAVMAAQASRAAEALPGP